MKLETKIKKIKRETNTLTGNRHAKDMLNLNMYLLSKELEVEESLGEELTRVHIAAIQTFVSNIGGFTKEQHEVIQNQMIKTIQTMAAHGV